MLRNIITLTFLLIFVNYSRGQNSARFADSIRKTYVIPELGYAVISANSVQEIHLLGVKKINTSLKANVNDRFRIGSNTKAITGFIAALLVKKGKLSWDTRFFDLFPEMKASSRKEHQDLTLYDLLTFRARLFMYTYTDAEPAKGQFKGNAGEQRYQFAKWFFAHEPIHTTNTVNFSNLCYVAAGLMLEKASGKSYEQLVHELGQELNIDFQFGQPNTMDASQTWGHNSTLQPEPPGDNYKLNWLMAAGNINVTLPDYVKFIQLQLQGLQGRSGLLSKKEFELLHFGTQRFAVGWLWAEDKQRGKYSFNVGNPGSFLSKVYIFPETDKAYILLSNVQTERADEGIDVLYNYLSNQVNNQ